MFAHQQLGLLFYFTKATVKEVAKEIGVAERTLYSWLDDKEPPIDKLKAILVAVGYTDKELDKFKPEQWYRDDAIKLYYLPSRLWKKDHKGL